MAAAQSSAKLRYGFQAGQSYAYDMKIVAQVHTVEETRQGVMVFEIRSATEDQFVMRSSGHLGISRKGGSSMRSPFPPFVPRPPMGFGPFGVNQPIDWTITRGGDIAVVGRVEQIPYLLGPSDLLIIEPLPVDAKSQWSTASGTGVVEKSRGRIGRFGPPRMAEETGYGGTERTEYSIVSTTADTARINKKYTLSTTPVEKSGKQFTMTGGGELQFDLKRGVFTSASLKYQIKITETNLTLVVPVSVTYRLMTDAELAELRSKEKEAAEAAAEAARPKPLTTEERASILKDLRSREEKRCDAALERLGKSVVGDNPDEISAAVVPYLNHPNDWIKPKAAKALVVWATSNAEAALIEASQSDNLWLRNPSVEALGRLKSPAAAEAVAEQLPRCRGEAGKALRAMGPVAEAATIPWIKDRDHWVRSEALEVLKAIGGPASLAALKEELSQRGVDKHVLEATISAIRFRRQSQGDTEPETPAAKASSGMRMWHDISGTFEVEAIFIGLADKKVSLKRRDGRIVAVPMERLSAEDQAWVEQRTKQATDPFQ